MTQATSREWYQKGSGTHHPENSPAEVESQRFDKQQD